jgi:hypothetical protein
MNATNSSDLGGTAAAAYSQYGATLPSGKTETGDWGGGFTAANADTSAFIVTSFPVPLAAALGVGHAIFVSGSSATNCPGVGQAAAGYLCVYQGTGATTNLVSNPTSNSIFNPENFVANTTSGAHGFAIAIESNAAGTFFTFGSYAVTAA